MIEVQHLTKDYGPHRSLDGLTFTVPEGEVLGFLGPNGAGKSTTMRILTGLVRASGGTARVAGFDVTSQHESLRRVLGYLPEEAPLYPEMRVREYLRFMAGMKLVPAARVGADVDRVLGETNLWEFRARVIGNLSKGTRQRIGLAQALLGDPKVVVLDEPTVGLDPGQISEIRQLIASMKGRRTVILSTHILPEVAMTCSRVVIINRGRIATQGPLAEIGRQTGDRRIHVRALGEQSALAAALAGMGRFRWEFSNDGAECAAVCHCPREADPRAEIAAAVVGAGLPLIDLHEHQTSLEDVFLRAINDNGPEAAGA